MQKGDRDMLKYVVVGENPDTGRVEDWYGIAPTPERADKMCAEAEEEFPECEYTWYALEEEEE